MYLKEKRFNKKAYVVGSDGITKELEAEGIKHFGVGVSLFKQKIYNFLQNFSSN